jgi:hypothetical protein
MLVPEAPPNFDDALEPGQDDVGFSGKTGDVQPKTESHPMDELPHRHLGRSVFRPDLPHVLRTPFWR